MTGERGTAALEVAYPLDWDAVTGQHAAVEILRAALRTDQLAHAWMLVGPAGVGQEHLAAILGAVLNCEDPPAPDLPCGLCRSCVRIGRRQNNHPSVQAFLLEASEHLVSVVRDEWIPVATHTALEGRHRVLYVEAADRMNEAAQNAFLKTLEEPPDRVTWILDVQDDSQLLDTIVSRCRRVDVKPWGTEDLARSGVAAHGLDDEAADRLARAAMGSPARLHELADESVREARHRHLGLLGHLRTHGPGAVVASVGDVLGWAKDRVKDMEKRHKQEMEDRAEEYGVDQPGGRWPPGVKQRLERRHKRIQRQAKREAYGFFLDDLTSYLRDLLAVRAEADPGTLINADHAEQLQRDRDLLDDRALLEGIEAAEACRSALDANGNPALQLERLVYRLSLALYDG